MSDNESSDSRSQAGADPGGYRFPFGVHQGKRIEDVPQGLRYWAVHPNRNKNRWYADLAEANNRYEEHLCNICQPHEWILPFSKYMGKTIAEVPEDYRWRMANPQHSNDTWYPWFVQANNRYQASLNPDRSPGSEIIWFGKRYKGYRFDAAYNRKGFVNFCLAPDKINMSWYARFKDLCERYEAWLSNHRREYRPRRAAVIQNPVGEPIGPWDDRAGSADPDEEYERDNFVVSDGEEIVTESEHGSFLDNDDDMDVDDDDNDYKPSQEEIGNTSGPGIDDERGNIRQAILMMMYQWSNWQNPKGEIRAPLSLLRDYIGEGTLAFMAMSAPVKPMQKHLTMVNH
ncbi:hypothetical protein BJ138DRAFT_303614 [Hygrophoropsis aurantiaca]|uniref:Uncharacterized protein n=1 Tax=Hygrophoropsis aurantiaca TaxID=72124 RepID=A0ACB8A756_9AGAM|nr:hypothetical protein BJ138DRAFT_303614 [Hygrophoropsis aurantiaca]